MAGLVGACSSTGTSDSKGTSTTSARPAESPPTEASRSTDQAPSCTYTDPAHTAISVSRALTCPDETEVWVKGTMMTDGTDSWLCDEPDAVSVEQCAANGLQLVGDQPAGFASISGIKRGTTLSLGSLPRPVTSVTGP